MAPRDGRTAADVRRDIEAEREQLADAVDELRSGLGEVTDIGGKLRAKLPLVAAGALGAGFFLAGGSSPMASRQMPDAAVRAAIAAPAATPA